MQQARRYFDDRLLSLPFWYRVAVQYRLLPAGCLDDLMSADVEVQRRCLQEYRDDFFFMCEDNNSTQYTCRFLACFDIENSVYDKCRWNLLYEILFGPQPIFKKTF